MNQITEVLTNQELKSKWITDAINEVCILLESKLQNEIRIVSRIGVDNDIITIMNKVLSTPSKRDHYLWISIEIPSKFDEPCIELLRFIFMLDNDEVIILSHNDTLLSFNSTFIARNKDEFDKRIVDILNGDQQSKKNVKDLLTKDSSSNWITDAINQLLNILKLRFKNNLIYS